MKNHKIIFIDFDGVITTLQSHWCLCPSRMNLVKEIIEATDAKIVISSSWRRHTLEKTIEHITDTNNPFVGNNLFSLVDYVVGIIPRMYAFKEGNPNKHYRIFRGEEIRRYLDENEDITNYVIIDDSLDMLLCQKEHFVHTDSLKGIQKKDVLKAINILNK